MQDEILKNLSEDDGEGRVVIPIGAPDEPDDEEARSLDDAPPREGDSERLLRALADLENLRRRRKVDRAEARRAEREAILRELTGVIDNMDRALEGPASDLAAWTEGWVAIRQQTLDLLKRFDAEPFEARGAPFDPERHEAVGIVPAGEFPDGSVAQVVQEGFAMRNGVILRPAKVMVAKQSAS